MPKKTAGNYDAEQLVAERHQIGERIEQIHRTLTHTTNHQLSTDAADARVRAESYLNYHANGKESGFSGAKKDEYLRLKQDAAQKLEALQENCKKENALRAELNELKTRLNSLNRTASAGNVLQLQTDVSDIKSRIADLTTAISREEEKVRQGNSKNSPLDDLNRQREDLLADIALGTNVEQEALEQIDEQIAVEEKRVREAYSLACQAQTAIAGLQRKVSEAEQELSTKKEALSQAYCDFLITEAEKAAAEFSREAEKLWGQFTRVLALGEMVEKHPSAAGKRVVSGECRNFNIPAFMLEACSQQGKPGYLFDFKNLDIPAAIKDVKSDITALGIMH